MIDAPQQAQRDQGSRSPGKMLREAREAAGLSHAAVGETLHLTAHYIRSIESDEYNKLPGLIFVKGYIKSYGNYLKLDVEALLGMYEQRVQDMPAVQNQTLAGNYTRKRNDQAIGWAIAATLVILVGLGIGWWFVGRDEKIGTQLPVQTTLVIPNTAATSSSDGDQAGKTSETQPDANTEAETNKAVDEQAPAVDASAAATPAAPLATPSTQPITTAPANTADKMRVTPSPAGGRLINLLGPGPDQLQMNFGSNSWAEIEDASGKRLYADMLHSGDILMLQGRAPFQVLLGDARNVKVNFNATPIDISTSVRNDSTARLTLANPGNSAPPVAENSAAGSRTAGTNP